MDRRDVASAEDVWKMARVARGAHRVNVLPEGAESGSRQGQGTTSTRANKPCNLLPLVLCCATESSAFC